MNFFYQIILQMRVHQWIKNSFIFIPILVSGNFFNLNLVINSLIAFVIFSITSSTVYVINDLKDIKKDRNHPKKSKRPLASGTISKTQAIFLILFLTGLNVIFNITFDKIYYVIITYLIVNFLYTFYLKKIPIVDAVCIAFGFVLRVLTGILACNLEISNWIISLAFFLCLTLAFGKRYSELSENYVETRDSINLYDLDFLKNTISSLSILTITIYLIYTIDAGVYVGNKNILFMSNIPVVIGLLYYNLLNYKNFSTENPTSLLLNDKIIISNVIVWSILIVLSFFI